MLRKLLLGFTIVIIASSFFVAYHFSYMKVDSDQDGFIDELDSFPNNPEFHKKCCVDSSRHVLLSPGQEYYPSDCKCFDISCKCKHLCIDWKAHLDGRNSEFKENENIKITVISPFLSLRYNKNDLIQESGYSNIKLNLDEEEYFGQWTIYFLNDMSDSSVYIDYDIYRIM